MNCDSPGGVWLAMSTVTVASVHPPWGTRSTDADTDRYWSSLLPPRLMTAVMTESAVRRPDTPASSQVASAAGAADHTSRCRPWVAAVMASDSDVRSSDSFSR